MRVIDYFDKGVALDPARAAIVADDASWTYAEAQERSWRIACGLHVRGLLAGERVGVLSPNAPDALIAMLGIWRAGGAWAPLNPLNALESTTAFMNEVDCRYLFLHSRFQSEVQRIREAVPGLRHVVCLDEPFSGAEPMEEFIAAGAGVELPDWGDPFGCPELVCATFPTGGTTGRSKAVLLTNQVWATLVELSMRTWPQMEGAVNLVAAPITHAAGVMAVIFATAGATIVIRPKFDADDVLDRIEPHRVTHLFLPPTAYYRLLERQQSHPRDVSSLKMMLIAAAPVSPDKLGRGVEVFGPCIAQCWGQAEAPFLLTYLSAEDVAAAVRGEHRERLASAGKPTFSVQVGVIDDEGRQLGAGERGELVTRGRLVTPGYLNRPDATEEVRRFGWHLTGDVGYLDEHGYVYIVDRKKDMIITGGFNVYPAEVEAAILGLPEVRECAVIGVPDPNWGEAVRALVVPAQDGWAQADYVIEHAKQLLGSVKAPKQVDFVEQLPRTPVGKTDKRALRAEFWSGLERAVN
ncbi:MAG TPA: AMP-binding protein [Solirubrobacteraceae bacterium]|nr:AMP-binding protein [Solirubrobacteraceae bacterium]